VKSGTLEIGHPKLQLSDQLVVHVGEGRCGEAGGREDGEGPPLTSNNILAVAKNAILTGCYRKWGNGDHLWFGSVRIFLGT